MKVIIAGSRSVSDLSCVMQAVSKSGFEITKVISGNAEGVDRLGEWWAVQHNIPFEIYPANWQFHGKSAGFIRNAKMAEVADALIAVWDGNSKGTQHMIKEAKRKGLEVFVYQIDAGE